MLLLAFQVIHLYCDFEIYQNGYHSFLRIHSQVQTVLNIFCCVIYV
jgi:hypothetical protein